MALNIVKRYLTKNRCYQSGVTSQKIGIQIHTIGTGQDNAEAIAEYWDQSSVDTCVHYCVDAEVPGLVLQFLPESYRSWADAGYGNNNLITIEICESDAIVYTNGALYDVTNFTKFKQDILRGYWTTVELCAHICREYGWNPQAKLPSGLYLISSHDEGRRAGLSSGHVDPTHVWDRFGLTMNGFRADVAFAMGNDGELTIGMKVRLTQGITFRTGVSTESEQAGYVKYTELPKLPSPPRPPLRSFTSSPSSVTSQRNSPESASNTTVPQGTSTITSSPSLPNDRPPVPLSPFPANMWRRYLRGSRVHMLRLPLRMICPPRPPSPPSGPPFGIYLAR